MFFQLDVAPPDSDIKTPSHWRICSMCQTPRGLGIEEGALRVDSLGFGRNSRPLRLPRRRREAHAARPGGYDRFLNQQTMVGGTFGGKFRSAARKRVLRALAQSHGAGDGSVGARSLMWTCQKGGLKLRGTLGLLIRPFAFDFGQEHALPVGPEGIFAAHGGRVSTRGREIQPRAGPRSGT